MNPGRNNLLTTLIDTFFPRRCPGCGSYDVWICETCIVNACDPQIELWNRSVVTDSTTNATLKKSRINKFVSLGLYHQPLLETAMDLYKFHRATELAAVFAKLLAPGITELINGTFADSRTAPSPIILIPVPLHKRRIRERGFNQNLLLAEKIVQEIRQTHAEILPHQEITCRNDLLIRTHHTKHQTTVTAQERAKNLENAFALTPGAELILNNATIILIDDIVTTGATLNELAATITRAQSAIQSAEIHTASVLRSPKQ